jgi:hypothetical protein
VRMTTRTLVWGAVKSHAVRSAFGPRFCGQPPTFPTCESGTDARYPLMHRHVSLFVPYSMTEWGSGGRGFKSRRPDNYAVGFYVRGLLEPRRSAPIAAASRAHMAGTFAFSAVCGALRHTRRGLGDWRVPGLACSELGLKQRSRGEHHWLIHHRLHGVAIGLAIAGQQSLDVLPAADGCYIRNGPVLPLHCPLSAVWVPYATDQLWEPRVLFCEYQPFLMLGVLGASRNQLSRACGLPGARRARTHSPVC